MGNLIMVLGKSGSGKSTSLRNFRPEEVGVFSVTGAILLPKPAARKTALFTSWDSRASIVLCEIVPSMI